MIASLLRLSAWPDDAERDAESTGRRGPFGPLACYHGGGAGTA
jgi:hypothetical protein